LLHDLFSTINRYDLNTAHARICTEKGVAMDTLYITDRNGNKVHDPNVLDRLRENFADLVVRRDPSL